MSSIGNEALEGCRVLRLDNTAANLIDLSLVRALRAALEDAARERLPVVLAGKDKFFSNGLDLRWALSLSIDDLGTFFGELGDLVLWMLQAPIPIVGAMRGHAIGAAKTLLLACDYRYAAAGRAKVGSPEINLGVPNPYFADQLLRFTAGDHIASDLIYSGRLITVEEARNFCLLHGVEDDSAVETAAVAKAISLARIPAASFAASKRNRTQEFCTRVRAAQPGKTDEFLEIWYLPETQSILRRAAESLAR